MACRLRALMGRRSILSASSVSPVMQRVRDRAYLALSRYQPRFYPGKIRFVRAQISTDFPADAAAIWGKLANEFEVETVPGDHLEIITTYFARLASVLSRFVREALCSESGRAVHSCQ